MSVLVERLEHDARRIRTFFYKSKFQKIPDQNLES